MTVEEARTKVCPFIQHGAIVAKNNISFGSVDQFTHANINCIASECMAWRFDPKYAESSPRASGLSRPAMAKFLGYSDTEGYCERLSR